MSVVVADRRVRLNGMNSALQPPSGYPELLQELKSRIRTAQVRAALAVNRELVLLYWSIGRDILSRQGTEGGEPRSSIGWPMICRMSFRVSRASAPEASSTCALWLRPGRRNQLCNSLLHNCPGATMCAFWTESRTAPHGSGISGQRSSTAGVKMSWFT